MIRRGCLMAAMLALFAGARSLAAQEPPPRASSDASCYGFSFGTWTPALDWKAAGHRSPDSVRIAMAEQGRGWAAALDTTARDTLLILFPQWWPAGVVVELSAKPSAVGDTVTGRATALVADASQRAPVSRVRAWAVPCRR